MNRKPTPSGWSEALTGVLFGLVLLGAAWLLDVLFPQIREALIPLLRVRSPAGADWLDRQRWPVGIFIPLLLAAVAIWIAMKFMFKKFSLRVWKGATHTIHGWISSPPIPSNCVPVSEILHNKLKLPEEDLDTKPLELLGRTDELDWLKRQAQATRSPAATAVRVILLWGAHGIGKTHLAFRFATGLSRREYRECGSWHAWSLNREFDPKALADNLPKTATILLWDDISLDDDASHRRLQDLLSECAGRKQPLLVVLTGWRPRLAGALTRDQALVDVEREVGPLDPDNARSLYASAADLPEAERGHPLLLRLLSRQAASAADAPMPVDLWESCQQWAGGYTQRLESKYGLSPAARQALAVVSSSETCSWPQVQATFGLNDADHRALQKIGQLRIRQGAVWLEPVRPDLLGWAYALHALAAIPLHDAEPWALHAWKSSFFDTGRFLSNAKSHGLHAHVWVRALLAPPLGDVDAALQRIMAAALGISHHAAAGQWRDVALEIDAARVIASSFPEHQDIQLAHARGHGIIAICCIEAKHHEGLAAELAVINAISDRFLEHVDIQTVRAQSAVIGVIGYGVAELWGELENELAKAEAIASHFIQNVEIQTARSKAAARALDRLSPWEWPDMFSAELMVAQSIASRFPEHPDIQLARAQAASSTVDFYSKEQRWDALAAELETATAIALRFPEHVEINLARAESSAKVLKCYKNAGLLHLMTEEIAMLQGIASKFTNNMEIQLQRVLATTEVLEFYCANNQWNLVQIELALAQEIAVRFAGNEQIQVQRAAAAASVIMRYGPSKQWDAMAMTELAVLQGIAKLFPANIGTQYALAICFLKKVALQRAMNLSASEYSKALCAQLDLHPELLQMSPFNEMLADAASENANDFGPPEAGLADW